MKQSKKQSPMGWRMLLFVILLYGVAAWLDRDLASQALQESGKVLLFILPILLVILLIMAMINHYLTPKQLSKYLGAHSGIKGWGIAILSGVLSHGPGYVWYPLLRELRSHGVQSGLIVAFFYARAVKLPWLPMMVGYFGLEFTIVLTLYTLMGALLQGIVAQKFLRN